MNAWRVVYIKVAALGLALATPASLYANDLKLQSTTISRSGSNLRVTTNVSWKNSWRNSKNFDAVWLVVKLRVGPNGGWGHARIAATSPTGNGPLNCQPSSDRIGTA